MEPNFGLRALQFGTVAASAGIGARILKHILDVSRNRDVETPVTGKRLRPAIAPIPIDVTPEEAQTLGEQGIQVKMAEGGFTGPFFQNALLGAGALATAGAGWKLADTLIEAKRKVLAKTKLDRARARVEGLLVDEPFPEDAKLAGFLDCAADEYLKTASTGGAIMDATLNLPVINSLGYLAGPAALLGVYRAYQSAKQKSLDEQKSKAMTNQYVESLEPETPTLTLQPVLRHQGA